MKLDFEEFLFPSGLNCALSVNSLTKFKALKLAKRYNLNAARFDPTLNERRFIEKGVYRVELFHNNKPIGLAAITVSVSDDEDDPAQAIAGVVVEAAFVINEYRKLINGNHFGYCCAVMVSEFVADEILTFKSAKPITRAHLIVDASCLTQGGVNFCEAFGEYFEVGDFEELLMDLGSPRIEEYQCSVDLDTLDAEMLNEKIEALKENPSTPRKGGA